MRRLIAIFGAALLVSTACAGGTPPTSGGPGASASAPGITVGNSGKTIEIKFAKVFCPATAAMGGAGGGILPSAAFKKVYDPYNTDTTKNIDDNPLNMAPPASMGPFVFKEFKPGVQVTLTNTDKHFRRAPLVDQLASKVYA